MSDAREENGLDGRHRLVAAPFDLGELHQHAERAADFLTERYGARAVEQSEKLLANLTDRGASIILAKRVVRILTVRRQSPQT